MEHKKIFEEVEVDCNDCEAYWLNQCDGVSCNSVRKCVSYIPTKRVDIPNKIQVLERRVNTLDRMVMILSITMILAGIVLMFVR
jgi:hypothetical protein